MAKHYLPEANGFIPADLVEQMEIAGRIRHLCETRFGGDRDEMIRVARVSPGALRDLLRGKTIDPDALEGIVKRLCLLRSVNSHWLRRGEGSQWLKAGELGIIPAASIPIQKPTPPKDPPMSTTVNQRQAGGTIEILTEVLASMKEIERKAEGSATSRADTAKDLADIKRLNGTLKDAFENRTKQLEARLEEQGVTISEQHRRQERLELAMLAIRKDLDEIQEAATKPAEPTSKAPAGPAIDEEDALHQDSKIQISSWFALRGHRPTAMATAGMASMGISQYFRLPYAVFPDHVRRIKGSGRNDTIEYPVRWLRWLVEFIEQAGGRPRVDGTRDFLAFLVEQEKKTS